MTNRNRREFLAQVGQGMLIAGVGPALAADLGLASAAAAEGHDTLSFGDREPLVALMQETPADKLLPVLVAKLQTGTGLNDLVAAAALANARTFGGHNYDGYHAFMALTPAYQMAQEMPADRKPLPVLKVLHRNTRFMQQNGGRKNEALHPVEPAGHASGEELRTAARRTDQKAAEQTLAALARTGTDEAYNALLLAVQDDIDVHRIVLAWRAWATLDLTGREQALTLLRQSIRFCIDSEKGRIKNNRPEPGVRAALPKLLDQYRLLGRPAGTRKADDAWVDRLAQTVYEGNRNQAADAAAAALAEGFAPEDVAEAIGLAATRLVLRDPGRDRPEEGKPVGSIHGASVGVHASDAANAWRNIARVSDPRNAVASLIVAAYHTAGQAGRAAQQPYPWAEHLAAVKGTDATALLAEAEAAITGREQAKVCAVIQRYGEQGHDPRGAFQLLLRYATSEDGALHAEKYYRTVAEEFTTTRPAFRWRHLVALARVTASEYGYPAPGYAEACRLLKV